MHHAQALLTEYTHTYIHTYIWCTLLIYTNYIHTTYIHMAYTPHICIRTTYIHTVYTPYIYKTYYIHMALAPYIYKHTYIHTYSTYGVHYLYILFIFTYLASKNPTHTYIHTYILCIQYIHDNTNLILEINLIQGANPQLTTKFLSLNCLALEFRAANFSFSCSCRKEAAFARSTSKLLTVK